MLIQALSRCLPGINGLDTGGAEISLAQIPGQALPGTAAPCLGEPEPFFFPKSSRSSNKGLTGLSAAFLTCQAVPGAGDKPSTARNSRMGFGEEHPRVRTGKIHHSQEFQNGIWGGASWGWDDPLGRTWLCLHLSAGWTDTRHQQNLLETSGNLLEVSA